VQVTAWRTVSEMTYNVSSGTSNITHSLTLSESGVETFAWGARDTWFQSYQHYSSVPGDSCTVHSAPVHATGRESSTSWSSTILRRRVAYCAVQFLQLLTILFAWNSRRAHLTGAACSAQQYCRVISPSCQVYFYKTASIHYTIPAALADHTITNSSSRTCLLKMRLGPALERQAWQYRANMYVGLANFTSIVLGKRWNMSIQ